MDTANCILFFLLVFFPLVVADVCKRLGSLTCKNIFTFLPNTAPASRKQTAKCLDLPLSRLHWERLTAHPASCKPSKFPLTHPPSLTVEWHRKPNVTMTMAGVRTVPNTSPARQALIVAMIRFWAVTSTEQAQQSRDPRSSRGPSLPTPPLSAAE